VDQLNPRLTDPVVSERPSKGTRCDFCHAELSAVQEFIYHVESFDFVNHPVLLEIIRRMPRYQGEPLRLCRDCRASIEMNIREKEDETETIAKSDRLGGRLILWLLFVPLGVWVAFYTAVEIIHKLR
jgi:hypothetical protein